MIDSKSKKITGIFSNIREQKSLVFTFLVVGALFAFEIFNFSTTEFAMGDILGELRFAGVRWSTILALAFCGIDFAGIARIFTQNMAKLKEERESQYMFGAWLLAATMNAMLTWWGVSIAIANHQSLGNMVVGRETLMKIVPIFVAIMVWLIRILIIGSFSASSNIFGNNSSPTRKPISNHRPAPAVSMSPMRNTSKPAYSASSKQTRRGNLPVMSAKESSSRQSGSYQ